MAAVTHDQLQEHHHGPTGRAPRPQEMRRTWFSVRTHIAAYGSGFLHPPARETGTAAKAIQLNLNVSFWCSQLKAQCNKRPQFHDLR